METSTSILEKFKQNKVFKVVSGYAIVALATVQIASLVSDSFGFGEEFMQNIILIFLLILPFIALVAWAASSRFSTAKILSITLAVLRSILAFSFITFAESLYTNMLSLIIAYLLTHYFFLLRVTVPSIKL